jgi:YegS/Rv2252/BmrU family lipid kinase
MSNYKFIVNPISGRGAGERAIPEIRKYCELHGFEYDIVRTERPQHAISLAQEAVFEGSEEVVAVGGDGTANEVINGLMHALKDEESTARMGIVGVGRGNDFAYGVGIPAGIKRGFDILVRNQDKPIDVGNVSGGLYKQGRYFGNGVGIGFDAVVGFEALKMTKLQGFLSYIIAAIKTVFLYYNAPLVRIEYNNESMTLPALLVSIMNGRRMGGGFQMAPHAEMDDGKFNICIAEEVSKAKIFYLILQFMKGS